MGMSLPPDEVVGLDLPVTRRSGFTSREDRPAGRRAALPRRHPLSDSAGLAATYTRWRSEVAPTPSSGGSDMPIQRLVSDFEALRAPGGEVAAGLAFSVDFHRSVDGTRVTVVGTTPR